MGLAEDVDRVVQERLMAAPTDLAVQVYRPSAAPPEKAAEFMALKQKKNELLVLAHELDELIQNF
jgi:hypothetical protein